jgi:hypothetical protein
MIPIELLNAVGLERTYDTMGDMIKYYKALENESNFRKASSVLKQMNKPFYRFFSNYGTGIGETVEEIVGNRFKEFVPKQTPKIGKKGQTLKSKTKNEVYIEYNKKTGKKPSNYDHLASWKANANIGGVITSWEVKVIRAVLGKPKQDSKLYEIPSLLEERSLPYKDSSKSANVSFQQTKPGMFDYLLGVMIYNDQVDFYIVPSEDIKSGKLNLINQHAGAINEDGSTDEGHLLLSDVEEYKVKTVYTEEELLSKDSLLNYINK